MKRIQLGSISVIHSNWLPYATGCLISHCTKNSYVNDNYVFLTPWYEYKSVEEYSKSFNEFDILGLTCYVWNQAYNDVIAKAYKQHNPNGVVIYGGPNIPADKQLASMFADDRPFVDLFFVGPGEENFLKWLCSESVEGTYSRDRYSVGNSREYQVTELPTPYTDGVFDPILHSGKKIKASFETNRGCPYSCSFCDWGGQAQSKLTRFDRSTIQQQLDYIYSFKNVHEVEILDANFGIVPQDIETIDYMIECQSKYQNKPVISYSGLAKNGSKWLPEILHKIFNNIPINQRNLKLSFQTHNKKTLEIIQRNNIDNTKLYPLIETFRKEKIPTTSELIIALPGETAITWLETLDTNFSLNIDYIRTYFLNVVPNTPLYQNDYKEKYGIKTKMLRFPYAFNTKSYKEYHSNINQATDTLGDFEEIEIVYECDSFDLDEVTKMFDYQWFYHNLINTDGIKPIVQSVKNEALQFYAYLDSMPFFKTLVIRNRNTVRQMFSPEPISEFLDMGTYFYFSRCMRFDDVYQIWKHKDQVLDELSLIYTKADLEQCISTWKKEFDYGLYGTDARLV